ncbi:hypothetical protein ACKLNO_00075 [Neisseriaceae bacterium B1]
MVGLGVGYAWAIFEMRHDSPVVDVRTSLQQPLLFTNLALLTFGILMFTNLLLITLRLQNPLAEQGFAWTPAHAGMAMFAVAPCSLGRNRFGGGGWG